MNWVVFLCQPFVSYLIVFILACVVTIIHKHACWICFRHKMLLWGCSLYVFVYHDSNDSWTRRSTCFFLGGGDCLLDELNFITLCFEFKWLDHKEDVRSPHFGSADESCLFSITSSLGLRFSVLHIHKCVHPNGDCHLHLILLR